MYTFSHRPSNTHLLVRTQTNLEILYCTHSYQHTYGRQGVTNTKSNVKVWFIDKNLLLLGFGLRVSSNLKCINNIYINDVFYHHVNFIHLPINEN